MARKKKMCMECGELTEGSILRDPESLVAIYVDLICEDCVPLVFLGMTDAPTVIREIPYVGSVEAVAKLPEYVEPIDPPLGWNGDQIYIEDLYHRMSGRGEPQT